ncbi:hypothetical protein BLNAU_4397 [Blattamonas nauphoetae]|uniref:Uncharacterized protein n=1 Tax=Blattamonas nauphoetae TaxID=2049346 RepID=A0ABQ9YA33_9EUKA|nr:hypothetical protein BLNAU_4397 [Blattamonas nauphoetae]
MNKTSQLSHRIGGKRRLARIRLSRNQGRTPITTTRKSFSKPPVSSQTPHAKSRPVIVKAAPKTSQQPRRFSKYLSTQRSAPIVPPADPVLCRELQVFHAIFPIVNTILPFLRTNSTRILLTEYEQYEEKGRKSRIRQEDDSDSSLTPYPPQPAQNPLNSPTDNDHVEFEDGAPFKPITAEQSKNESSSIDSDSLFDTESDSDQSWNEWGFGFGGVEEEKRKDWTNVARDLYRIGLIVCLIKTNLDKQIVHHRSRQTSRTLSASISSTAYPPDRGQSVSSNIPRLELLKLSNTTASPRNDILAPVVPSSSQSPQIMRKNFPHSASSKEQRSSRRFQREKEIVLRSERFETIQRGLVDVDLDSRGEGFDDVLFRQDDSERKEEEPKARSRNSVSDWDSVRDNSKNELEDNAKRRFEEPLLSSDRSDAEVDRERLQREKGTGGQRSEDDEDDAEAECLAYPAYASESQNSQKTDLKKLYANQPNVVGQYPYTYRYSPSNPTIQMNRWKSQEFNPYSRANTGQYAYAAGKMQQNHKKRNPGFLGIAGVKSYL